MPTVTKLPNQIVLDAIDYRFTYNSINGDITAKVKPYHSRTQIGDIVGTISKDGYRNIVFAVEGKYEQYKSHRIAWYLHYRIWPSLYIDHINGNKSDNRICNLRLASWIENCVNRKAIGKSGLLGVRDRTPPGTVLNEPWEATISVNCKEIKIGYFATKEEAVDARRLAEEKYHKEFSSHQSRDK